MGNMKPMCSAPAYAVPFVSFLWLWTVRECELSVYW